MLDTRLRYEPDSALTRASPRRVAMSQSTLLVQIVMSAPDSLCVRISCP